MANVLLRARLLKSFKAPKEVNGTLTFKNFKKGDLVTGKVYDAGSNPFSNLPVFKTKSGYMIPESYLDLIEEEIQDAVEIKDEDLYRGKLNLNNRVQAPLNIFTKEASRSKYVIYGGMVGGLIGLIYAMKNGKSKPIFSLIGLVAGGAIGNAYNELKNE